MIYNAEEIGKRIKALRKEKKMTQLKLAEELNITDNFIAKIEGGSKNPSIDLFIQMSEFFGVSLDFLILGKK